MPRVRKNILTIAGFDPSGGAGCLADIKSFEANKTLGYAVQTALTIQNKDTFDKIYWNTKEQIIQQLDILYKSTNFEFVKIGLVENLDSLQLLVDYILSKNNQSIIVWDPILKVSAGYKIHDDLDYTLVKKLLKKITIITPNFNECSLIFGTNKLASLKVIIDEINGAKLVLKGGHNEVNKGKDFLFIPGKEVVSFNPKPTHHISEKHGSGCVFSSVLIANLAKGSPLSKSVLRTKRYMENFLSSTTDLLGYHIK